MITDVINESEYPRKYLQFPLFLLRGMFDNKTDTINRIIKYGIYRLSKGIEYDLTNVARQTIYHIYRGEVNSQIRRLMQNHVFDFLGMDEDYNGFSDNSFEPVSEIDELMKAFNIDDKLKALCIEHYCIRQALSVLNLTGDVDTILKYAKAIEKEIGPCEVMPMIGKHLLFHYRDNDKNEFDIAQLLAYIAIRSIIGIKAYSKTNKLLIISRMFGYSSIKKVDESKVHELYFKYSKRHHIDKTLKALEVDWNVCVYSNRTRGLYVSINNKMALAKLVEVAEKQKQSNKVKQFEKTKCSIISTAKSTATMQQ